MVPRIWWATSPISCSQHLTFHYYSTRMLIQFFLARPCIPKLSFVFVLFFPGMVQHQHQPVPRRASWLKMWKFTLCTAQHQDQPTNQDQPAPTPHQYQHQPVPRRANCLKIWKCTMKTVERQYGQQQAFLHLKRWSFANGWICEKMHFWSQNLDYPYLLDLTSQVVLYLWSLDRLRRTPF